MGFFKKKTKLGHYTKFLTNLWFWVMHELWKLSMCPQRILQKLNDFFFLYLTKDHLETVSKKISNCLYIIIHYINFHISETGFWILWTSTWKKKILDFLLFFCLWHYSRQVMTSLLILGLPQSFFFLVVANTILWMYCKSIEHVNSHF